MLSEYNPEKEQYSDSELENEEKEEQEETDPAKNYRALFLALTQPIVPGNVKRLEFEAMELGQVTPEAYFGVQTSDFAKLIYYTRPGAKYANTPILRTNHPISEKSFHKLLQLQAFTGDIPLMLKTFQLMKDLRLEPSVMEYTTLISGCKADCETVERLFTEVLTVGVGVDGQLITAVMNSYCTNNRINDAYNLMRSYALGPGRTIEPDPAMFSTIIRACINAKNLKLAWETFDLMRQYYTEPDTVAFNLMIEACAESHDAERAFNLYEELQLLKYPILDSTFNSLLKVCSKRHDYFLESFDVFQNMKISGFTPTITSYHYLLSACGQVGDVQAADLIIEQMEKEDISPTLQTYSILMAVLARALPKDKTENYKFYIERANLIFDEIKIFSEEKMRNFDPSSSKSLREIENYKINTTLLNNYLLIYANAMNLRRAEEVFKNFSLFNLQPDVVSYNIMLKAFSKARKAEQCFDLYRQMKVAGIKPDDYTWKHLIVSCAKAHYINNALKIIRIMIANNVTIKPTHIYHLFKTIKAQKLGGEEELKELVWAYPECRIFFLKPPPARPTHPEPISHVRPGVVRRKLKTKRWKKKSSNRANKPR